MRLAIVTPAEVGISETFIKAHVERLPFDVVALSGRDLAYCRDGVSLRETHARAAGYRDATWLNILPRYLEFRIRRRLFSTPDDFEIAKTFLKAEKIDVVLAEYGPTAAFISPVCESLNVPLVAHFHGFDASRFDILATFASRYRRMFAYASAVISVSTAMSAALQDAGCPAEKIHLNPYGPAPEFFEVEPSYNSDTIVAVGRHTPKKAPYLTLDAFRRAKEKIPELRLVSIGDGELFETSERLVKAWGLGSCVALLGAAGPAVVRAKMSEAFAFVQHSVRARDGDAEGTPVAVIEAGAAGLPVISTRHAGIPEVVRDGETGYLVEPGDSASMAERILELATDRVKARSLGAASRAWIRENYSLERHLGTLDAILQAALAQSAVPQPT